MGQPIAHACTTDFPQERVRLRIFYFACPPRTVDGSISS